MAVEITELHCIMPITNVSSVMLHGILSYEQAEKHAHASVAMHEVQERRDHVQIPGGLKLHQYANLYFHARNPMLYKRRDEATRLCILRIDPKVLSFDNVVVTDQNAASDYVRFLSPAQLDEIRLDLVFARDWTDPDRIAYFRRKAAKCAEVLVPGVVPPQYLIGAHVVNDIARQALIAAGFDRQITLSPDLFFF